MQKKEQTNKNYWILLKNYLSSGIWFFYFYNDKTATKCDLFRALFFTELKLSKL